MEIYPCCNRISRKTENWEGDKKRWFIVFTGEIHTFKTPKLLIEHHSLSLTDGKLAKSIFAFISINKIENDWENLITYFEELCDDMNIYPFVNNIEEKINEN